MKNLKSIITGILSGAVFFMAVQVGVAQEINKKEATNAIDVKMAAATNLANATKILSNDLAFLAVGTINPVAFHGKERASVESKIAPKPHAMVTYGVTDEDSGRLYLTEEEINLEDGDCGAASYPCKVIFDPEEVEIKEDAQGRPYIDEQPTNPQYTPVGQGPFTP